MTRVASIAFHTFKESVRERVLYNLIVFAFLMIGAALLFGTISVGIEEIIVVNLGLSSISLFGLVMAIFLGIGLVSKEIERRTIYSILAKPVARAEFLVGKYLGLLLTLAVNTSIMTAGFYLALWYEKHRLGPRDFEALGAVYFILLQLAVAVGLAMFFSCISTPILSAVFTLCLFVIGNFLSDIRWFGQESKNLFLQKLTEAIYYALPNFGDFNVISSAAHGQKIPDYLLVSNSLYALLYVTLLISAAILIFEEREFQ